MSTSIDWIFWITAVGVVLAFCALIWTARWALFADRGRGRRRCPRCWYDLAYSPGMTCAECGFTARSETEFHKTRRRWRTAGAAIIACVALFLYINEVVTRSNWVSILPARTLLMMLPFTSGPNSSVMGELAIRAGGGKLSASEWESMIDRCIAGDWLARPTSDAWAAKYGNFILQWRSRLGSDSSLLAKLNAMPPRLQMTARDEWPADAPLAVMVDVDDWWAPGMECRIRATPQYTAANADVTVTIYRTGDENMPRRPFCISLPPIENDTTSVAIHMEVARRPALLSISNKSGWEVVVRKRIELPIRLVESDSHLPKPVDSPEMLQAVQQVFAMGAVKWATGNSPVRMRLGMQNTFDPVFENVAVGLRAEILCDGEVARRLDVWWLAGEGPGNGPRHYGFDVAFENQSLLRFANADDRRWQVRVTGDQLLALRAGNEADKYWAGQFTLPLTVQMMTGSAPERAWRREE